ncbi:MAG: NAD-binding protein, partial [Verrucomicrobiales bacterium]
LGAGQIAKLANQIIVAQTIAAIAEALTLAKAAGVDPAGVREAIRGGFAESRILAEHGERMVTGNFVPGGRSRLQLKDVREAVRIMEEQGLELPMLRQNHALWEEMVHQRDMGDLDHSGLWRLYEARIGEL